MWLQESLFSMPFGLKVDFFLVLWVLAGGKIPGFASINTIVNAITGLIFMLSRTFNIGDKFISGSSSLMRHASGGNGNRESNQFGRVRRVKA
jgi:small-conductance mechanosensitive channel